jgi:hypothetical protein
MESRFNPVECNDDDVLSFEHDLFKVGKFKMAVDRLLDCDLGHDVSYKLKNYEGINIDDRILQPNGQYQEYQRWFNEGIDCEILKLGSNT